MSTRGIAGSACSRPQLEMKKDLPESIWNLIFQKAIFSSDDKIDIRSYTSISLTCKKWKRIIGKVLHYRFYIGSHCSPTTYSIFLDIPNTGAIIAKTPKSMAFVKIQNEKITSSSHLRKLLRNFHLIPTYQKEKKEVQFLPIPPKEKTWKIASEIEMLRPCVSCKIISRLSGGVSYAFRNTVETWNWRNSQRRLETFSTSCITALAELSNGDLIIGDNKGRIYTKATKWIALGSRVPIEEIVIIDGSHCLLETGFHHFYILNTMSRVLQVFNKGETICVLGEGILAIRKDEEVQIKEFSTGETLHKLKVDRNYDLMKSFPGNLLFSNLQEFRVWNLESRTLYPPQRVDMYGTSWTLLDSDTLIFGVQKRVTFLKRVHKGILVPEDFAVKGNWCVTSIARLSDGSIMYASDTRGSGIYVVTNAGAFVRPEETERLANNDQINSLIELTDGSVAMLVYSRSIRIITPQIMTAKRGPSQSCSEVLKQNPYQLGLYDKLVEDPKFKGRVIRFCAGIEAAMKSGNSYQARRFYEKARRIYPQSALFACNHFLSYLEGSSYVKLRKRIQLDFDELQRQRNRYFNVIKLKQDRGCKERLLIGEGDFSYTESLLEKHKNTHTKLAQSIIATELSEQHELEVISRIDSLVEKGVRVFFGVDGQKVDKLFKGRRFKRIHWNYPFGQSLKEEDCFKKVIPNFFLSCSRIQVVEDRIHVTLVGNDPGRQLQNPIVLGSAEAGYRLIRKRRFDTERYPGYRHVKTGTTELYRGGQGWEFVFEKVGASMAQDPGSAVRLKDPRIKNYEIKSHVEDSQNLGDYWFECSTDEDSSDYYTSDED